MKVKLLFWIDVVDCILIVLVETKCTFEQQQTDDDIARVKVMMEIVHTLISLHFSYFSSIIIYNLLVIL